MTTLSLNRPRANAVPGIAAMLQAWISARETRKALSRLSERELDDIGLCRADIDTITRWR